MKILNSPAYYLYDYLFDKYIELRKGEYGMIEWEFGDKEEASSFHLSEIIKFFSINIHLQPDDYQMVPFINENHAI